jgi:hypothetical protein
VITARPPGSETVIVSGVNATHDFAAAALAVAEAQRAVPVTTAARIARRTRPSSRNRDLSRTQAFDLSPRSLQTGWGLRAEEPGLLILQQTNNTQKLTASSTYTARCGGAQ